MADQTWPVSSALLLWEGYTPVNVVIACFHSNTCPQTGCICSKWRVDCFNPHVRSELLVVYNWWVVTHNTPVLTPRHTLPLLFGHIMTWVVWFPPFINLTPPSSSEKSDERKEKEEEGCSNWACAYISCVYHLLPALCKFTCYPFSSSLNHDLFFIY